jgi:hypothetical protein
LTAYFAHAKLARRREDESPRNSAMTARWIRFAPVALCLSLGACASVPPTGPTVTAVAGSRVSDAKFARDDAACRSRAYAATERTAAAGGQFDLQRQYNSIYSDCMLNRGYTISEQVATGYYYGPGSYYGAGSYVYGGPVVTYGWSGGWGGGWYGGRPWGYGWGGGW